MIKHITFLTMLFASSIVSGIESTPCPTLEYSSHSIYTLHAQIHKSIHIVLPDNLAGEPVLGNSDHWKAGHSKNHVYVRPSHNNIFPDSQTTLSLVTVNGLNYDFLLKKHKTKADLCLVITGEDSIGEINFVTQDELRISDLNNKIATLTQKSNETKNLVDSRTEETLNAYKKNIYSNYSWKVEGKYQSSFVTGVHDDGLFTYVTISQESNVLPQLSVVTDGNEFVLSDIEYNEFDQMFTINGIYDHYTLTTSKGTISIKRNL